MPRKKVTVAVTFLLTACDSYGYIASIEGNGLPASDDGAKTMALIISSSVNYHWVKEISAHTNGGNVLKLTLRGDRDVNACQFNEVEINVFMDADAALTERLIAAINGAASKSDVASVTHECERCDSQTANLEQVA